MLTALVLAFASHGPLTSAPSAKDELPEPLARHAVELRSADTAQVAEAMAKLIEAEPAAIDALIEALRDPTTRGAALEQMALNDEAEAARVDSELPNKLADAATVRALIAPYLDAHITGEVDAALTKRLKAVERKYKKDAGKLLAVVPKHSTPQRKKKLEAAEYWRSTIEPAAGVVEDKSAYPDEGRGASGQKRVDSKVRKLWRAHLHLLMEFDKDLVRFRKAELEKVSASLEDADRWRATHSSCLEVLAARGGVRARAINTRDDERIRLGRAMVRVASGDAAGARELAEGAQPLDLYETSLLRYLHFKRVLDYNDSVDVGENKPIAALERDVVHRLNLYRLALDREPLEIEGHLLAAARGHSAEMRRESYFSHDSPHAERSSFSKRTQLAGYQNSSVAECIYSGAADMDGEDAFLGWYGSSIHHRILISTAYNQIGVGRDGKLVTANFGAGRVLERW